MSASTQWGRMRMSSPLAPVLIALGLVLVACGDDAPPDPAADEQTYGAPVDAAEAVPAPAVAADPARYRGRRVVVDGRIVAIRRDGCRLLLDAAEGPPIRVDAPRPADACAWTLPADLDGVAVAAGTLRANGDSLRLSAHGVQVTPRRQSGADSAP